MEAALKLVDGEIVYIHEACRYRKADEEIKQ